MIGVVVSRPDRASEHVGEHLLDLADWTAGEDASRPDAEGGGTVRRTEGFELRTFDEWHLELDGVAAAFDDPDLVVFASRHSGETGPLLTAHHTGNFGAAEFGGNDRELARACPNAHARVLAAFAEFAPEGYDVGTECTHHGPTDVGAPSMFVELGSGERQWEDPAGARAVARSILALRGADPDRDRQLVGVGGGHYAPRFERVVRETGWAVGHVAADWSLSDLGRPASHPEVVDAMFAESGTDLALFDGEYPDVAAQVSDLGYRVVSETWVRETDGVPLDLVDRLESAVRPVDEGLRLGDPARAVDAGASGASTGGTAGDRESADGDVPFAVVEFSRALFDEAHGIDPETTRATVAATALAFDTEENGRRPTGTVALPAGTDRDAIVDALVAILRRKYDAVERDGGVVRAVETAFDPGLAREQGVPEGPKFGRLADGEPVEVDGRRVEPEAVSRERVREFRVGGPDGEN